MRVFYTVLFALIPFLSFSQSQFTNRISKGIDVGLAFKNDHTAPSFTYYELLHLGRQEVFSLGWTFRAGGVYGRNLDYTTAPARLTRGETGFGALTADVRPAYIDTLHFDRTSQSLFNVGLVAQVKLGPVELGGSADILGFALGRLRNARISSSKGGYYVDTAADDDSLIYFAPKHTAQSAHPRSINVRLLGDNDRGSLATEVYARFLITKRIGVKVAYQWLTTEMKLNQNRTLDGNLRYRNRVAMPYIALSFPLF
ncbi:hypothetical protein [Arsenicibacter rosenii]|uniref:Outer membrane protein beta-barrel domain-containing protein n=1 Tax=Arsenicibacter rosenii TaxID=1750698 RepID=A0A1S2VLD1_9BACT|nr:hypothetical protein [Arsenicibacter rosenii]OIN59564.1 hypothetical protein BLX24_06725 [Arsenicibacter rosenii]